jgi:hypothetical protein
LKNLIVGEFLVGPPCLVGGEHRVLTVSFAWYSPDGYGEPSLPQEWSQPRAGCELKLLALVHWLATGDSWQS